METTEMPLAVPRMKIPVFVSAPSPNNLSPEQERSAEVILALLNKYGLAWRALGRSDYPSTLTVDDVSQIVRHCSGGLILGFEQLYVIEGEIKRGSPRACRIASSMSISTPWNQIEAGILVASSRPTRTFREPGVAGGVFETGSTLTHVHDMPTPVLDAGAMDDLEAVFQNWVAKVRHHYYDSKYLKYLSN